MSEYIENQNVATVVIDNRTMPNAYPTRKMFSSIPVGEAQYTEDNRGTNMRDLNAIARYARKAPLQKVFPGRTS